jgi:hypothetical protein
VSCKSEARESMSSSYSSADANPNINHREVHVNSTQTYHIMAHDQSPHRRRRPLPIPIHLHCDTYTNRHRPYVHHLRPTSLQQQFSSYSSTHLVDVSNQSRLKIVNTEAESPHFVVSPQISVLVDLVVAESSNGTYPTCVHLYTPNISRRKFVSGHTSNRHKYLKQNLDSNNHIEFTSRADGPRWGQ